MAAEKSGAYRLGRFVGSLLGLNNDQDIQSPPTSPTENNEKKTSKIITKADLGLTNILRNTENGGPGGR